MVFIIHVITISTLPFVYYYFAWKGLIGAIIFYLLGYWHQHFKKEVEDEYYLNKYYPGKFLPYKGETKFKYRGD